MTAQAGPRFARRLVAVPPRSRCDGSAGSAGELWFVVDGSGRLDIDGRPGLPLRPDRGLWIPPGTNFRIYAAGPADLRIHAVMLPAATEQPDGGGRRAAADPGPPRARDLRDCEVESTGDRSFRVLFGPGRGCELATQFVGEIPPGRAPEHSHPYDELVLVLAGAGVLHAGGARRPLSAGASAHLPPGQPHCLENTGPATMRVLGVFHPADSPAAKAGRPGSAP